MSKRKQYPDQANCMAQVIRVIRTELALRGDGKESPMRRVIQYWTLDGEFLAEVDSWDR